MAPEHHEHDEAHAGRLVGGGPPDGLLQRGVLHGRGGNKDRPHRATQQVPPERDEEGVRQAQGRAHRPAAP